jgi:hypothetical protein
MVLFGEHTTHNSALNSDQLQLQNHNLNHLDAHFSKEKIHKAEPWKKAPGPHGYTGLFYKLAWPIIKQDLIQALQQLYNLRAERWSLLNSANVVMIAKKQEASKAVDSRRGLMHSVAKILAKKISQQISSLFTTIASTSQSTLIKGEEAF